MVCHTDGNRHDFNRDVQQGHVWMSHDYHHCEWLKGTPADTEATAWPDAPECSLRGNGRNDNDDDDDDDDGHTTYTRVNTHRSRRTGPDSLTDWTRASRTTCGRNGEKGWIREHCWHRSQCQDRRVTGGEDTRKQGGHAPHGQGHARPRTLQHCADWRPSTKPPREVATPRKGRVSGAQRGPQAPRARKAAPGPRSQCKAPAAARSRRPCARSQ